MQSFWELGFEKENLIVDKLNNLLLVHVCQLFMVSQLSVFWTYQTGACGGKNKKFWRRKKKWNSKLGFCEFPVTLLHICTDYNIYALCHSAISQFRRAISTLSSSFLDTIWYTFTLDLEKKITICKKKNNNLGDWKK